MFGGDGRAAEREWEFSAGRAVVLRVVVGLRAPMAPEWLLSYAILACVVTVRKIWGGASGARRMTAFRRAGAVEEAKVFVESGC